MLCRACSLVFDTLLHLLGVAIRRKDMADNRLFSVCQLIFCRTEMLRTSVVAAFYSNRDRADPRREGMLPISDVSPFSVLMLCLCRELG